MIFNKEDKFLLIKIFKSYLDNFDIYDDSQVIELFKIIFLKVKSKYNLSGLFEANIYVNDCYGMIIEINNLCYYKDDIDLKIKVNLDSLFLVEIASNEILDFNDVYYYNEKFYGVYNDLCDKTIIYNDVEEIISKGIKIC